MRITVSRETAAQLRLDLVGRLDAASSGPAWRSVIPVIEAAGQADVLIDASGLAYCDGAGAALLLHAKGLQGARGRRYTLTGAVDKVTQLVTLYDIGDSQRVERPAPPGAVERVGILARDAIEDMKGLVGFYGEVTLAVIGAFRRPGRVRWGDTLNIAAKVGVDALPIILLLGVLIGVIMAFQSLLPMRKFGADLYVANIVGLSVLRELGPLITAIIVAGRSGSAFAAELGTMKVNEEIDALTTMAIQPVQFLVLPRLIATTLMMPLLTCFTDLFSIFGGGLVMAGFGFPPAIYVNQLLTAARIGDFAGGLAKSVIFGILIAGIGCARGFSTGSGASSVGASTTRAVVSGIVAIVIADGFFSVTFYYLDF